MYKIGVSSKAIAAVCRSVGAFVVIFGIPAAADGPRTALDAVPAQIVDSFDPFQREALELELRIEENAETLSTSEMERLEARYVGTHPHRVADLALRLAEKMLRGAEASGDEDAFEKVVSSLRAFVRRFPEDMYKAEIIRAKRFIGDAFRLGRSRSDFKAEQAYEQAVSLYDPALRPRHTQPEVFGTRLGLSGKRAVDPDSSVDALCSLQFISLTDDRCFDQRRRRAASSAAAAALYGVGMLRYREFEQIEIPSLIDTTAVSLAEMLRRLRRDGCKNPAVTLRSGRLKRDSSEEEEIGWAYWRRYAFAPWMEKKIAALNKAVEQFSAVLEVNDHVFCFEAAARVGDMRHDFAAMLKRAPLPPAFRDDPERLEAYEASMSTRCSEFDDDAKETYKTCVDMSVMKHAYTPAARYCAERLAAMDPENFPLTGEIYAFPFDAEQKDALDEVLYLE